MHELLWKAIAAGAAVVAGLGTRKALASAWQAATGAEPPTNPADPAVGAREALAWGAATGAAVGVARIAARRAAAGAWRGATGDLPENLRPA